tara:strand:- start:3127 stop:3555 length:429 start_codon:yes stop_codon:yes gene_type:complete
MPLQSCIFQSRKVTQRKKQRELHESRMHNRLERVNVALVPSPRAHSQSRERRDMRLCLRVGVDVHHHEHIARNVKEPHLVRNGQAQGHAAVTGDAIDRNDVPEPRLRCGKQQRAYSKRNLVPRDGPQLHPSFGSPRSKRVRL